MRGQPVRPATMNLLISAFPIFGGKTTKELVLRSTLPQDARHDWSTWLRGHGGGDRGCEGGEAERLKKLLW